MTRNELHDTLTAVEEETDTRFRDQPERVHQLHSALSTAHMAIDLLFDHMENMTRGQGG